MVTISQLESGLTRFIDNEMVPKIPVDGANGAAKRLGFIVGLTYMVHKQVPTLLSTIGAADANGNVDFDGLAVMVKKNIPEGGLKVQIPMVGELIFFPGDIDKIKSYILGG